MNGACRVTSVRCPTGASAVYPRAGWAATPKVVDFFYTYMTACFYLSTELGGRIYEWVDGRMDGCPPMLEHPAMSLRWASDLRTERLRPAGSGRGIYTHIYTHIQTYIYIPSNHLPCTRTSNLGNKKTYTTKSLLPFLPIQWCVCRCSVTHGR